MTKCGLTKHAGDINSKNLQKKEKGSRMFNEEIVKAGYSNILTVPPNVKFQ